MQALHHFVAAAVPQVNCDARKFRTEACDPPGEQERRTAFHQADVQVSGKTLQRLQFLLRLIGKLQNLPCAAVQVRTGVGNGQVALSADEKLNAEFILKALDLAG